VDLEALKVEFDQIMYELQPEFDWLYGTTCDRCGRQASIHYTVWSDVYKCCRCGTDMVLWDVAVDHDLGVVREVFACPHCGFTGKKTKHTRMDSIPVVTNYECQKECRPARSAHRTTEKELRHIEEISAQEIPCW
jgi:DNA-directed RNA polymerase subunit RPC12/RpoP